jgi:two-component system, NarL family, sensor histidine kinase DegS
LKTLTRIPKMPILIPEKVWPGFVNTLKTPHLWLILAMVLAVSFLYYSDLFDEKNRVEWIWYIAFTEYKYTIHGSLAYLPLLYSAITFGWKGILATWIIIMAILLPRIFYFTSSLATLFPNILFLTAPLLIILLIALVSHSNRKEKKMLAEREAERQAYLSQVFKAHEDERKRIAQALHDDTIQTILSMAIKMQSMLKQQGDQLSPQIKQQLDSFKDSMFRTSEDLRKLSINLRPSILDDIGLTDALSWLVNKLNDETMKVELTISGELRKLPPDTDVIIFRFVQEALNNAKKHSEATRVNVYINFSYETISVKVQDNGKGFVMQNPARQLILNGKLGITGMQEKARFLGGRFDIFSEPGKGTVVSIVFKA